MLIDMDGVIADFEGLFFQIWQQKYPNAASIVIKSRLNIKLVDDFPIELRDSVKAVYHAPGFFSNIPFVPGAPEALNKLKSLGHDVYILTKPLRDYTNCVREKYDWVGRNLGNEWIERLILTRDKTLVTGNILIDDWPEVTGLIKPSWEHVLYDRPYNKNISGRKRITWGNESWQKIIGL